jgi:hypothetical protein
VHKPGPELGQQLRRDVVGPVRRCTRVRNSSGPRRTSPSAGTAVDGSAAGSGQSSAYSESWNSSARMSASWPRLTASRMATWCTNSRARSRCPCCGTFSGSHFNWRGNSLARSLVSIPSIDSPRRARTSWVATSARSFGRPLRAATLLTNSWYCTSIHFHRTTASQ